MATDWNPVSVEEAIREKANQISQGVNVCDRTYRAYLEADRDFDVAVAKAFMSAEGSVDARKHQTTLATVEARQRRDDAEAAFRYADRRMKALDNELRAYQSIGASVRETYRAAGTGQV